MKFLERLERTDLLNFVVAEVQKFELDASVKPAERLNIVLGQVQRLQVVTLSYRTDLHYVSLCELEEEDSIEVELLCVRLQIQWCYFRLSG